MINKLLKAATEANLEDYLKLVDRFPSLKSDAVVSYLRDANYFTAPSSFKFHGDWIGGNFDHSVKVTELLLEYTASENLKWTREESPYIIGLFHDMCKCDQRKFVLKDTDLVIVSANAIDKRHSERSIELIEKNIISMTVEEKLCIYYHMGEYGGDEEYQILMKEMISKNPNILFTQLADTTAAKMGI
ncbi:MAG: HD domain-containing protein [Clostridiales bacterium]|nr:HD domain-containing protein [Clostridiales bacterium]